MVSGAVGRAGRNRGQAAYCAQPCRFGSRERAGQHWRAPPWHRPPASPARRRTAGGCGIKHPCGKTAGLSPARAAPNAGRRHARCVRPSHIEYRPRSYRACARSTDGRAPSSRLAMYAMANDPYEVYESSSNRQQARYGSSLIWLRHDSNVRLRRLPTIGILFPGLLVRNRRHDDDVIALLPVHGRRDLVFGR